VHTTNNRNVEKDTSEVETISKGTHISLAFRVYGTLALLGILGGQPAVADPTQAVETLGRIYAGGTNARVQVYVSNGRPKAALRDLDPQLSPELLSVDKAGNLYVAENLGYDGHSGNVLIYPPGATVPSGTLFGEDYAASQACPANDGTVYVVNIYSALGTAGSVAVYSPSRQFPAFPVSYMSPDPNSAQPKSCAIDAGGNLFVAFGDTQGGVEVDEYPAGSSQPTNLGWSFPSAGGIAVDGSGDLLIPVINGTATGVYVYKPGNPSPVKELAAGVAVGQVAVTADHTAMWVTDQTGLSLDEYDLSTGAILAKITANVKKLGVPRGIALSP
jgi:hypothetical protein